MSFGHLEAFKQAENRSGQIYTDQWGREYEVIVDHTTKKLAWVWAYPRFTVPHKSFIPPQSYLRQTPKLGQLRVDIDQWINDNAQAHQEWNAELLKVCQANNAQNALELVKNPTREILRLMGPEPMPTAFLRAMRAGNRWVLGLTTVEPAWLDEDPKLRQWLERKVSKRDVVLDHEGDEKYADLEEQYDPEALGGKRVGVKPKKLTPWQELVREHGIPEAQRLWKERKAVTA